MSKYLDDRKTTPLKSFAGIPKRRYPGEILGPYKLIRIAGEGPSADVTYWKAHCLVCDSIVTVCVKRIATLIKHKGCTNCKGLKVQSESKASSVHEC